MANPLIYGGQQPNAATAPEAGVNSTSPSVLKNRNNFYQPYQYLNTERFADITPFLVQEVGFNEDFDYTRNTDLRAPTFASPIMSQLTKHAHYIAVPKSVIYPRLWELLTVIPKKGDDIDFPDCRAGIVGSDLIIALNTLLSSLPSITTISSYNALDLLRLIVFMYVSAGANSLPALLGCPIFQSRVVYSPTDTSVPIVDAFLKKLSSQFEDFGIVIQLNNGAVKAFSLVSGGSSVAHGIDDLVDFYLRIDVDDITSVRFTSNTEFVSGVESVSLTTLFSTDIASLSIFQAVVYRASGGNIPATYVNIENIIAYQMSCAAFFTSDDVDNIYTAHLWYQNINGLVGSYISETASITDFFFLHNGIRFQYEPYSQYVLSVLMNTFSLNTVYLELLIELFAIRKSLRYGDMFNSVRLRPLAVGDYSAPVVANAVSAVEMTNATLMQRLLNNVNAVRNTISSFIKMLYGVVPDDIPMQPLYVAHSSDVLAGTIVANTSDADQGKLVTNVSLHSQHREFSLHFNQDAILLGLTTYDCLQAYIEPLSPFALKVDRFDYFNPMLQNIGDQPVSNSILLGMLAFYDSSVLGTPFGYLQNDFEYKQSISQAHGAFADGLIPSWAFMRSLTDEFGSDTSGGAITQAPVVSSSFIRQSNREFNQFFSSLVGAGTHYYHFIVSYVHDLSITRPMEYVSGVLYTNSR